MEGKNVKIHQALDVGKKTSRCCKIILLEGRGVDCCECAEVTPFEDIVSTILLPVVGCSTRINEG